MAEKAPISVTDLIERQPVGAPRIWIAALCGVVALLDGLDLQSIGLAYGWRREGNSSRGW